MIGSVKLCFGLLYSPSGWLHRSSEPCDGRSCQDFSAAERCAVVPLFSARWALRGDVGLGFDVHGSGIVGLRRDTVFHGHIHEFSGALCLIGRAFVRVCVGLC
eukprot:COSAG02_NODE_110_length_36062_cov_85.812106_12_plen_103_part_00